MSALEDEVRAAIRERVKEITPDSIPPLRLPSRRSPLPFSRRSSRGPRHWRRAIAPLAAAAAVLAIAGGVTAATDYLHRPTLTSIVSQAGIPATYVALTGTRRPYPDHALAATVFATATGTRLATVTAPLPFRTFTGVSAAADDRTWVLTAQTSAVRKVRGTVTFFLLRVSLDHRRAQLTRLRGPTAPTGLTAFALSPDGRKLAWAFTGSRSGRDAQTATLRVDNLGTGTTRTWRSGLGSIGGTDTTRILTWEADNQTLAFSWFRTAGPDSRTIAAAALLLLDTAGSSPDLIASSRPAVNYATLIGRPLHGTTTTIYLSGFAVLAPGGQVVVAPVTSSPAHQPSYVGIGELSIGGRPYGRLLDWRPELPSEKAPIIMWSNAPGSVLIVESPPGHAGQFGVLKGRRLTLLPRPAAIQAQTAAW